MEREELRKDIIADIIRVANENPRRVRPFRYREYETKGKYSLYRVSYELGSWSDAIGAAGLPVYRGIGKANDALKFKVFRRDSFKCVMCGASPALHPSIVLHADHIVPYSKGGLTVVENLQTLCARCNIEKGVKEEPILGVTV